ncbi:hypothetical protein SNE40_016479 [Patella caerulea]|uniref:Uncharacterized protein n=1 Tax=Patella caerulea TaxID=87958 RepID=A0AAN8JDW7_PATCE
MTKNAILALLIPVLVGHASGNLNTYPAPHGIQASNKFQVYLRQGGHRKSSFTYITTSDKRAKETHTAKGGRSVSWTSFSFSGGAVTAEIHTPQDFHNCIVRPQHYGYKCQRTGSKTAHVTVSSTSRMMSVEFDYDYGSRNADIKDKMLIFADPPESDVPNEHDSSVIFYKAGVHNLNGQVHLNNSIKTIYLAPGAWVEGGFLTTWGYPPRTWNPVHANLQVAWQTVQICNAKLRQRKSSCCRRYRHGRTTTIFLQGCF